MDIAVETVTDIVLRLRAIEVKEGNTDPDSGSNPIDDGSTDVLTSGTDDATEDPRSAACHRRASTTTPGPSCSPCCMSAAATWSRRSGARRSASPASARPPAKAPRRSC